MSAYWKTVWILFVVFVVANLAFLHRVPGLMGDEASEGENVYELLRSEKIVVQGERSYIGPLIDYLRVPFIKIFGYTALSLRLVMFVASLAMFLLAAVVLERLFGETSALFTLTLGFFNPIYLTQARLGWAITLFPFFAFSILFLLTSQFKHRALLAGLAAGVGLSNHILFLPTLIAIVAINMISGGRKLLPFWPGLVGFIAGFAMQFTVLILFREDQGDVTAVAQTFGERAPDLPKLLPHVLSGSSYIASYTGTGLSEMWQWAIVGITCILILSALLLGSRKKFAWVWLLGLVVQLVVLVYMIDRFSLRYFAMPVIGLWILAGIGLGAIWARIPKLHLRGVEWGSVLVAGGLTAWSIFAILVPFLKIGGSTANFSLGNRTDSAAALVDTRPLMECLRGAGPAFSENVHIWNRLQFLSHQYSDLEVLPEDQKYSAKYVVEYRDAKRPETGTLCSELAHFRVVAK